MDVVKYSVEILETLAKTISVEAATPDKALYIITQRYRNGEIVLDSNDFVDVDFNVKAAD